MVKIFFRIKIFTAFVLLVCWYSFSLVNVVASFSKIHEGFLNDLKNNKEQGFFAQSQTNLQQLNYHLNENVYKRYAFIEAYGFLQRLLDKKEENNFEVVQDEQGLEHYQYFGKNGDVDPCLGERVKKLESFAQQKTKVIAIIPPEKDIPEYTIYETGLPNGYYNERADAYIRDLTQKQIAALDLRKDIEASSLDKSKLFFKTDHHWRSETAFWAYQDLADYLKDHYGFPINPAYLNKDNWNFLTYRNVFLGSMGRKIGRYYSGIDDITLIYPKFNTDYEMRMEYNKDMVLFPKGRFEEALLSYVPFRNERDPFDTYYDKYSSYLSGDYPLAHIVNKNSAGPKVLFIKDSIARPVAAFLSTLCSEVWLIDPRYYQDSMDDFVSTHDLDYIFIMFLPQDITPDFFPFGQDDSRL